MGDSGGNWVDNRAKDAERTINNPGEALSQANRDLGSLRYLNPYTAIPALYQDYQQGQDNQSREEGKQKEAESKYQDSLKNIENIADYQDIVTGDFRKNQDKYTGLLQDQDKRTLRGDLANTLTNTKNNFNQRGLLDSGIRKYSDASNQAKTLSSIQQSDFQNAQDVESQARDMEGQALKTRTAAQGGQVAGDISAYQQALANMQQQEAMYSGVGQAAGTLAGSYLAKKNAGK